MAFLASRRSAPLGRREAGNDLGEICGNRSRHFTLRAGADQCARRGPCGYQRRLQSSESRPRAGRAVRSPAQRRLVPRPRADLRETRRQRRGGGHRLGLQRMGRQVSAVGSGRRDPRPDRHRPRQTHFQRRDDSRRRRHRDQRRGPTFNHRSGAAQSEPQSPSRPRGDRATSTRQPRGCGNRLAETRHRGRRHGWPHRRPRKIHRPTDDPGLRGPRFVIA